MLGKVESAAVVRLEEAVVEVQVGSSSCLMRPWQEASKDYPVAEEDIAWNQRAICGSRTLVPREYGSSMNRWTQVR
jgi:hypothetical protein